MASCEYNPILSHVQGALGDTVVYKQINGKTYMTKKARPSKTESPAQKHSRRLFAYASWLASEMVSDPEINAEFLAIARRQNLSNAYTAALAPARHIMTQVFPFPETDAAPSSQSDVQEETDPLMEANKRIADLEQSLNNCMLELQRTAEKIAMLTDPLLRFHTRQ